MKISTKVDRSAARDWILAEVAAGRNGIDLPQRLCLWARQQTIEPIGYEAGIEIFLDMCRDLHLEWVVKQGQLYLMQEQTGDQP